MYDEKNREGLSNLGLYAKKNRRYVEETSGAVQSVADSLSDDERINMNGTPGTPYLPDSESYTVAKRFLRRDERRVAEGFLDLYWASKGAVSACVAVRPESRKRGVASSLVADMLSWLDESFEASALGIERVNWFARRDNPASIRLATTAGFAPRRDYEEDAEWWGGTYERHDDDSAHERKHEKDSEETNDMERQIDDRSQLKYEIDHADIVTSHLCNRRCEHCIDSFLGTSREMISEELVEQFLTMIDEYTNNRRITVLLLGGEPTVLPTDKLIAIADIIHAHGDKASMSTNGIRRQQIIDIMPYYDSIQITFDNLEDMREWEGYEDKINAKSCGDHAFTMAKLWRFKNLAKDFQRRSVSMYFTDDFCELCRDKEVWDYLDGLTWSRNGSYMYAIDDGVRFKRCIPNETNIIDEPTIPKLYPNGSYNRTWRNEELDDYLSPDALPWLGRR